MFHRSLFAGSLSLGVLRFAKKIPNLSFTASAPRSFPDPKFWSVSWLEKKIKKNESKVWWSWVSVVALLLGISFFFDRLRPYPYLSVSVCPELSS